MIIGRGKLYRGGDEKFGVLLPCPQFQVRSLAGVPMTENYDGPGFDNGARIMLGRADSVSLLEYAVDEHPTAESMDEIHGAYARISQLRPSFPAKATEAFRDGWQDADRQLRNETPEARAQRHLAIRFERAASKSR